MLTRKKALEYLSNIPYINSGGCLVSAYAMFLNERRNGNHKVRIHAIDIEYALNRNIAFFNNTKELPISNRHYVWTYYKRGRFWDSNGVYKASRGFYKTLEIPEHLTDKFVELALQYGNWNKLFDRVNEIPKIESYFNIEIP